MRVLILVPFVSRLCDALAFRGNFNESIAAILQSRDATPDNPDDEPDYTDPKSNAQLPRSKILPFDVNGVKQPLEAKNRTFGWDSTYN